MNSEDNIQPFKHISLIRAQIRELLNRLAGYEGCQYNGIEWRSVGQEFTYAKKILILMHIPEGEQEKLLVLCKEKGGCCDCEILMNAAPFLLGEETPW